jgi:hypothetical protein
MYVRGQPSSPVDGGAGLAVLAGLAVVLDGFAVVVVVCAPVVPGAGVGVAGLAAWGVGVGFGVVVACGGGVLDVAAEPD